VTNLGLGLWIGDETMGLLVTHPGAGTIAAFLNAVHATFLQKVILCAIAAFFAAALLEWGKVFIEGADDALNKGYKHRSPVGINGTP
jgi:hypothetical protein